jgi:shikimate kinase
MNITLIGMSGVGKSRIGKLLAEKLHYSFIDIYWVIEEANGKKLQELIDSLGDEKFLELEENAILGMKNIAFTIISPGGSAIYSEKAMKFLKSISIIVFLNASLEEIKRRTPDFSKRGIVRLIEKGLEGLYAERLPLYNRYADVTVDVENFSNEAVVDILIEKIRK